MMKRVLKLFGIILMFLIIINIFEMNYTKHYASGMSDISQNPGSWEPTSTGGTGIDDKVGIIASLVRTIGIIVSVGSLSIIGIKFMLGSVEEKAQYKQTMMPWIIGAIMVFAMTTIPTLLYDMSKGMFEEAGASGSGGAIGTPDRGGSGVEDTYHTLN